MHLEKNYIKDDKLLPQGFTYSSGNNDHWLTIDELNKILEEL